MTTGHPRLPVFLSYAHEDNASENKDERWLDRLLQMLKPLQLNNQVCAWSDRDIGMGQNWKQEVEFQLADYAEAAILLVSPAFLASDFIRSNELPILLHRNLATGLLVIPIIFRPCFFSQARFKYPHPTEGPKSLALSEFQAANSPARPLDSMTRTEQDEVFVRVGEALLEVYNHRRRHGT